MAEQPHMFKLADTRFGCITHYWTKKKKKKKPTTLLNLDSEILKQPVSFDPGLYVFCSGYSCCNKQGKELLCKQLNTQL